MLHFTITKFSPCSVAVLALEVITILLATEKTHSLLLEAAGMQKIIFRGSKDEECYGQVRLQPLVYMDDTARASHSVESMRAGNIKLACLMVEKQLEIHPTKSGYLLFGSEAFKAACRMEAEESPILLGKSTMREKSVEKNLGDMLHSERLSASVEATI